MSNRSNVIRLVSTQGMFREQWLAVRRGGIGSSDAAAAVGLSPYKSPLELWLEKTGRKEGPDLSGSEAVFWGTTLEAIVANVYANRTGNKVRRVNAVLQHPDHPFMLANLDRAVGCVFRANWPPIPVQTGHSIHGKPATPERSDAGGFSVYAS